MTTEKHKQFSWKNVLIIIGVFVVVVGGLITLGDKAQSDWEYKQCLAAANSSYQFNLQLRTPDNLARYEAQKEQCEIGR